MDDFFALSKEEAPDNIPMMFITVPSAKDPEAAARHPGRHRHCSESSSMFTTMNATRMLV